MTRARYAMAWLAYKLGDALDRLKCPTFAKLIDRGYYHLARWVK